jgi:TM2 domain-containing membrane protein YozV
MPNQTSAKYRLVALLLVSILPGTHRLYVGKIKTGLCMLLGSFLLLLVAPVWLKSRPAPNTNTIIIGIILFILVMVWLLWVLIDLSKISLGSFKDINDLTLLRRKNHEISEKSNIIAILLCTFLGFLGVHRFYLGKKISGLIILCSFLMIIILKNSNNISFINLLTTLFGQDLDSCKNFMNGIVNNYFPLYVFIYFLIYIFWVYFVDTIALLGGVMVDANNKLPKDFSSN